MAEESEFEQLQRHNEELQEEVNMLRRCVQHNSQAEDDECPYHAILRFQMPAAQDDLTLALYGKDCFFILHSLHNEFRAKLKHGELSQEKKEILEWVMNTLHSEMDTYNITLDMVE